MEQSHILMSFGLQRINLFELQVVRELFCQLAANMWSIPQAVAERQALVKQRELQTKLYQLNSPGIMPVLSDLHASLQRKYLRRNSLLLCLFIFSYYISFTGIG
jgi:hypothetical protein